MAYFNFNTKDSYMLKEQIRVLTDKYNKHRSNPELSQIEKERRIRTYVLEALVAYKYNPNQKLSDHPAANILNRMIGWLDAFGYTIRVDKERTRIRIFSARNTFVEKPICQDEKEDIECFGGILGAIRNQIAKGELE